MRSRIKRQEGNKGNTAGSAATAGPAAGSAVGPTVRSHAGSTAGPASIPRPRERAPARTTAPSLRTVTRGASSVVAAELWIGLHLPPASLESFHSWAKHADPLERLATRAQQFTPRVSLVPPDGLVLEVKGSLHLFNGVEGLFRGLAAECAAMQMQPVLALAPTPLAALVAARAGKALAVTETAQLVGQLMPLPLVTLRWSEDTLDRLARMGVRTIGQALRLPRAGFARRFGTEQLAMLDRLVGRDADLRERFQVRERFRRRRELLYELESHDGILAALAPLLAELGKFLEARQYGVLELECLFRHRHAPPTSCVLRLAAPAADVERLTGLLGERLAALTLPEPVRSCELRSGALVPRVLSSDQLWQPGEHGGRAGAEAAELIERLRVRLGPEAVYGLQMLPSHRPETAWGVREPARGLAKRADTKRGAREPNMTKADLLPGGQGGARDSFSPWPAFRRPVWLLPAPKLLSERDGLPHRRGPLRLLGEAERIETGWWDGGEIARDYYTAVDIHGVRLWVFRERADPHRWYLHGVFG